MVFYKQTYAELLRKATYAMNHCDSVKADRILSEMQYYLTTGYTKEDRADILKNAYESTTDLDLSSEEIMGAWGIVNIIEDHIGVDV